jgi:hypothetical protein
MSNNALEDIRKKFPDDVIDGSLEEQTIYVNGAVMSKVYGDCTACTIYMGQYDSPTRNFPIMLQIMSMTGRISAFFSLKVLDVDPDFKKVKKLIKELRPFTIEGLHVQKSNRQPHGQNYMVSGILKCVNPQVNDYIKPDAIKTNHNFNETIKYNEVAVICKLKPL